MEQNPINSLHDAFRQAQTDAELNKLTQAVTEVNERLQRIEELLKAQQTTASDTATSKTYIQ